MQQLHLHHTVRKEPVLWRRG